MDKWIEILRAGQYPQGNVSVEMLQQMADSYDPEFIQAPFIPEHRKYNEQGELINNMSALAWVKAVKLTGNSLMVLVDDEDFLKMYYDGRSYKYASAEIQNEEVKGKKVYYLGAIAVTNFPASKIKQIKLNETESLKVYTSKIIKEDTPMNKEQFIQLCKALGIAEDSTPEVAIQKLTELNTKLAEKGGDDFKAIADQLTAAIKLIKVKDEEPKDNEPKDKDADIKKLIENQNKLFAMFESRTADDAVRVFDQAVVDKKVLPSQKDVLVGTKEKPGTFFGKPAELKAFVDTLPVLKLTADVVIPKKEDGKPLTYNELLKDPKKYAELQESNPALIEELKAKRFESA